MWGSSAAIFWMMGRVREPAHLLGADGLVRLEGDVVLQRNRIPRGTSRELGRMDRSIETYHHTALSTDVPTVRCP